MATTWELLRVQCTTIAGVVTLGGNPRCASSGNITCNGTTCCANEKVVSHKCVAYPAGTTSTGDHDASADNTICDPKICGTNKL